MLEEKLKRLGSLGASGRRHQDQREQLDALCDWIDRHIDQPIGWQELIAQTGWDYQEIQTVFYRYKCTTARTWIRLRPCSVCSSPTPNPNAHKKTHCRGSGLKVAFATSRVMSVDVHPTDGGNLMALRTDPGAYCS
jgi:hypothetical protein